MNAKICTSSLDLICGNFSRICWTKFRALLGIAFFWIWNVFLKFSHGLLWTQPFGTKSQIPSLPLLCFNGAAWQINKYYSRKTIHDLFQVPLVSVSVTLEVSFQRKVFEQQNNQTFNI